MWLVQLPRLVSEADLEWVQRQVQGATQARMLRELADAFAVLTADIPLVLVLEDLHWSDSATVECLAALAQRREPARLLVLGTYRPVEAVLRGHPLRGLVQELRGRGYCEELRLEPLPAADVAAYVAGRLGGPVAASLAAVVHERTEGNALFMVNLLEHLVRQGLVVRQGGQWTLRDGTEAQAAQSAGRGAAVHCPALRGPPWGDPTGAGGCQCGGRGVCGGRGRGGHPGCRGGRRGGV